jgi:hypothetical protein
MVDKDKMEGGAACDLVGPYTCDLCGCEFITQIFKDNFCPNCGSDKWDNGEPEQKIRIPNIWIREIAKDTKDGPKIYSYYMATWREGSKTRNMHLGSCDKMSSEEAQQKAKLLKTKALKLEDRIIVWH